VDSFQVSWGSLQINPNLRVLDEDSSSATDSSADANVFQVIESQYWLLTSCKHLPSLSQKDACDAHVHQLHTIPVVGAMFGRIPQVKLEHPADIQGSVSLRGEEDGFFGHSVASCLQVGRPLTSS